MGLFSFIGKAAKAIGGLVGGPVGGVLRAGGGLLDHKAATAHTAVKYRAIGAMGTGARGKTQAPQWNPQVRGVGTSTQAMPAPRQVFSDTPVMPGGAIATSSGVVPLASGVPPRSFGSSGRAASGRRKKRSKTRSASSPKRKSGGRKLKFGSPAWRAKYMRKKKRRSKSL
jgi:hypothetical protein